MKVFYKKIIYSLTLILTVSFSMFSQSENYLTDSIDYNALGEELIGTYQIEMIDTRTLPSFPAELLTLIVDKREENHIVYHRVSENMRIKILPKSTISAPDFKPIKHINHISSKDL